MKIAEQYLRIAITKFEEICSKIIIDKDFNPRLKRVKYRLENGSSVFIQYNNYGEYSYSIIYSPLDQDLCRFDNYDQEWVVKTKPHHFHPRGQYNAIDSPMVGDPKKDIPKFCEFILKKTK